MLTHIRVRGYSEQTQLKPYFTTEFIHEKSEAWHFRVDIESNILRRTKYVDMLSAKDSRKDTYDETIDDNNIKVERRDSSFIGSTTFTLIVFDKSIYYEGHLFTAQDSNYKAIGRSNRNFQQAHSHQDISEFGDWGSDFLPRKSYTDLTFLPLAFPSDSNYYGGEVPTLNWTTSKSVVKYEMQLSKDSLFQEIVIDSIVSLTPFNIPSITGGKYFWRVRVRNSVGEGMWSNVARLKYSLVNSVAADHTQFIKIFPNPASNNLIFSFFVNKPSNVTLKLYDIFEKEIATLIENKILSDTQSMEFSTTNIPTGTYHCRLQIGQAVYSQKVIVLH